MRRAGDFFQELGRRRVYRVAAIYIVGAWVLLQAADLAFPGFHIPESAIRYVWIWGLLIFPIALVFGWRFDFVGGRIRRTPDVATENNLPLSRTDYVVLSTLTIAAAVITFGLVLEIVATRTPHASPPVAVAIDPKSIAVLPFENLSGDESNDPFTMGIHDDVLTHISKISDIKVISRTSVARLDNRMSIPEIGDLLNVATVLETGVQRSGDRIRINTQLIDTASDQHLWAATFDRQMTTQDIFAIQTEIAAAITDELRATLSQQDRANLGRTQTQSLQAYQAYLLGKQRMTTRTRTDLVDAVEYFEKALEHDPQYALAYVGLADANLLLRNYGYLPRKETLARAEAALSAVLKLDDKLGAAFASIGLSRRSQGDTSGAEQAFKRAIKLDPNYATPYHWYGDLLLNELGQPEEAVRLLTEARKLDPLSPVINITLGEALDALGRFSEAMALYRKSIEIEPDYSGAYFLIGVHYRSVYGRMDEGVRWHRKELSVEPTRDSSTLGMTYLELGDDETAEYWIDRAVRQYPDGYFSNSARAFLHRYRGEKEQALQVARRLLTLVPGNNTSLVTFVTYGRYEEALESLPLYPELACNIEPAISRNNLSQAINLSLALQETGAQACADRMLDAILTQIGKMSRFGLRGYGIADVEIHARQGNTRQALGALRQAIDDGFRFFWWAQGERSPHIVSLLEDPEFGAMMDEIRADMSAQLAHVREMEANRELAPIPK